VVSGLLTKGLSKVRSTNTFSERGVWNLWPAFLKEGKWHWNSVNNFGSRTKLGIPFKNMCK
ncbi:MAG: hypothetical protein ACTS5A_04020, partial [Candidatus Hodgkinia cicadicola]